MVLYTLLTHITHTHLYILQKYNKLKLLRHKISNIFIGGLVWFSEYYFKFIFQLYLRPILESKIANDNGIFCFKSLMDTYTFKIRPIQPSSLSIYYNIQIRFGDLLILFYLFESPRINPSEYLDYKPSLTVFF